MGANRTTNWEMIFFNFALVQHNNFSSHNYMRVLQT
nr:MAG TPA: hypothetical protein [Caudoviricetes sp.]